MIFFFYKKKMYYVFRKKNYKVLIKVQPIDYQTKNSKI